MLMLRCSGEVNPMFLFLFGSYNLILIAAAVIPAIFLLVRVDDADALYNFLLERGIIVRNRSRVKGCEKCLRITVGTPEENDKLLNALSDYEKSHLRRP